VLRVLDVAAVMPSKYIRLLTVDQVSHCFNPRWLLNSFQSSILCILNNLEDVTAFERITVEAYRTGDRLKLAASLAFLGR
jgi:hypothetical protein